MGVVELLNERERLGFVLGGQTGGQLGGEGGIVWGLCKCGAKDGFGFRVLFAGD
jgi:hypothetical protein